MPLDAAGHPLHSRLLSVELRTRADGFLDAAGVVLDLRKRGFVPVGGDLQGAGIIHDFEVALSGATSEEVEEALGPGRFGMAEETGKILNAAINQGIAAGKGIGQAVGDRLRELSPPHEALSLVAAAARLRVPVTVHVAIGTDIIHMHPDASGAALGEGSLRDFRYFVSNVARLGGGVYLNCVVWNRRMGIQGFGILSNENDQTFGAADHAFPALARDL